MFCYLALGRSPCVYSWVIVPMYLVLYGRVPMEPNTRIGRTSDLCSRILACSDLMIIARVAIERIMILVYVRSCNWLESTRSSTNLKRGAYFYVPIP